MTRFVTFKLYPIDRSSERLRNDNPGHALFHRDETPQAEWIELIAGSNDQVAIVLVPGRIEHFAIFKKLR